MDLVVREYYFIKNITEEEEIENIKEAWKAFVEQFYKFSQNFVHGDVRDGNIIFGNVGNQKDQFFLIDFDWSNSHGEAFYPYNLNNKDIKWPAGVEPG